MTKPLKIEIFRPGRHVTAAGVEMDFSEAEVAAIAAAYDTTAHEAPVVIGHPANDGPAYGWVEGLAFEDGALWASIADIEPAFAEALKARRYDKRSSAFYGPETKGNPTPGQFYLRHVGFLGAQPPGVKGLKPITFAEGDDAPIEFAESPLWDLSWALSSIGALFRRMRDKLIEEKSVEAADAVYPEYDIRQFETAAKSLRDSAAAQPSPAFSEGAPAQDPAIATRTAELDARAAQLAARESAIAAAEAEGRKAEDAAFVDGLVRQGRIAPGGRALIVEFLQELDRTQPIAFSEGGAATAHAQFKKLLAGAAPIITFREVGQGEDPPARDPMAIAAVAVAHINDQAGKGITVSAAEAVRHVQKGKSA